MFESHEFYCTKCGQRTIPLARKSGQIHKKFHLKKLYCIYCKEEINCVEIRNEFEREEFLNNWRLQNES